MSAPSKTTPVASDPPEPRPPALSARATPVGIAELASWLPLAFGVAAAAMVAAYYSRIIRVIHLNPDAAWAPVLALDLGRDHGGGLVLVGTAAHFTTIWFLVLTRWVPFRAALWDAAPGLFYLGGLALTAWACWRVAGRYPAAVSVAALLGVNTTVLTTVMAEGLRGDTYVADAVGVAFLVWWTTRPDQPRRLTRPGGRRAPAWLWPAFVVTVVVTASGTSLASDPLFLASGLGPFLLTPLLLWALRRDHRSARMAVLTTAMSAASAVVAVAVNHLMSSVGYRKRYETTGFALVSSKVAGRNLKMFGNQLRLVANATPVAGRWSATKVAFDAMALLLLGAVVVAVALAVHAWLGMRSSARRGPGDPAGFVYLTYWVGSGLAVLAAFSLTSFADGSSQLSRYVMPALFALAATVPVWAARVGWRRLLVAAGVSLFCALSITNLGSSLAAAEAAFHPLASQGGAVIDFLEQQDVTVGYAGYFDSLPLTLQSGARVHFYPVVACRAPISSALCPFYVNARTTWYTPRANIRSFLLTNTTTPAYVAAYPTANLGTPAMTRQFGALSVFVYDYDIASKLALPCLTGTLLCPDAPISATLSHPFADESGVTFPLRFTWVPISGAEHYLLVVGTHPDGKDVADSGILPPTAGAFVVAKLPLGTMLYASLLTETNGTWAAQSLSFTTAR